MSLDCERCNPFADRTVNGCLARDIVLVALSDRSYIMTPILARLIRADVQPVRRVLYSMESI